MNALRPLVLIILALVAVAWIGGIAWAGIASLTSKDTPTLPGIVTQAVTAIGGVLATHFGAVFGINEVARRTRGAKKRGPWLLRAPLRADGTTQSLDWIQTTAAYVYVAGLLGALAFWLIDGFSASSAQMLVTLTTTLIGVAVGILTVTINTKR